MPMPCWRSARPAGVAGGNVHGTHRPAAIFISALAGGSCRIAGRFPRCRWSWRLLCPGVGPGRAEGAWHQVAQRHPDRQKKLAGILVELQSAGRGPALAVIGVGLNVRMPEAGPGELKPPLIVPWTDLAAHLEYEDAAIDRNDVAVLLLEELPAGWSYSNVMDLKLFAASWQSTRRAGATKSCWIRTAQNCPALRAVWMATAVCCWKQHHRS